MNIETVTAGNVRSTRYDVEDAVDVAITVVLKDGRTVAGDITIVPDPVNGGWRAYGNAPDFWAPAEFLAVWPDGRQEAQRFAGELEAAASAAAKRWERDR